MRICWRFDDGKETNCFTFGNPPFPLRPKPLEVASNPMPGFYPELLNDAMLLNTIHQAATGVSDEGVRKALETGIHSAVEAMQRRGGKHLASISLEDGAPAQNV
jgi:hypothetical protein